MIMKNLFVSLILLFTAVQVHAGTNELAPNGWVDRSYIFPVATDLSAGLTGRYSVVISDLFALSTFLDHSDTPSTYSGSGSQCVAVNVAENALEFTACGSGGTDDQTAAEVPFDPYLTITSTDTQAAVQELKDELDSSAVSLLPTEITSSSTLVAGVNVQDITATIDTVQTFPTTGSGHFANIGNGSTVGQLTLTPPAGKRICRENGVCEAVDAVLYSAGLYNEELGWRIDINGDVRMTDEGGTYSTTP